MSNSPVDVLIIGAGPVGLTMAAALVHHGLTCRLIDKAPEPSDKSKALVLWSRTLELLDDLGLAETCVQHGLKAVGASIYGAGKRLVHVELSDVASPFGFPLMIPQNVTERLLAEHVTGRGVAIERRVELISLHDDSDKVTAVLRHADGREETVETPWLVGCDGAHSTVRKQLQMPFTGHAEPNDWVLADVHIAGQIAENEISIFWHESGIIAVFPIGQRRFRVIADMGLAAQESKPADPSLADMQQLVAERGPAGLVLGDPIWLAGFRINERKVSHYRKGRVMLAGDAAHIHSPAGGQGMNTGMQDAFNLAWKLALVQRGDGDLETLLDSYSLERSAVGDQVLRDAGRLTAVATLRNPVAQYLRNSIAPLLTSFEFVKDSIKNKLCELSINYRESPLTAEDWPWREGGAPAGDRLPEAPLTSVLDGRATTLYAALRDGRRTGGHSLLLLPATSDHSDVALLAGLAAEVQRVFPHLFSTHVILKSDSLSSPWVAESLAPSGTVDAPPNSGDAPAVPAPVVPAPVVPVPVVPLSGAAVWFDATGQAHRQFGVSRPTVIVVRPDGYLGYRGQPADSEKLIDYLDRYLIRKN